jgi:putative transport protein
MSEIALTVSVLALVAVVGCGSAMSKSAASALALAASCLAGLLSATLSIRRVALSSPMLHFIQEFGLILFVYTIGIQVGPGFFASLRVSGLRLNLFAILIVILGGLVTAVLHKLFNIPLPVVLGIFSGAVTNTPALGPGSKFCAISAYRSRWSIRWG